MPTFSPWDDAESVPFAEFSLLGAKFHQRVSVHRPDSDRRMFMDKVAMSRDVQFDGVCNGSARRVSIRSSLLSRDPGLDVLVR